MSTTVSEVAGTVQQRSVAATKRLTEILGLDDLKLLATALAEVAAEEAKHNPGFALRVRDTYHELASTKLAARSRPSRKASSLPKLTPIVSAGEIKIDPHAPLDPYLLLRLYGAPQLRDALDGYSLTKLKEASVVVEQKNPGTKPKSKASKAALITYIVEHVAGANN